MLGGAEKEHTPAPEEGRGGTPLATTALTHRNGRLTRQQGHDLTCEPTQTGTCVLGRGCAGTHT